MAKTAKHFRAVVLLGALALLVAEREFSGQASAVAGLIVGRVVDASTNEPLPGVVVSLSNAAPVRTVANVLTDGAGQFAIRGIANGSYLVRASTGGNGFGPAGFLVSNTGQSISPYLSGGFGATRPDGLLQPVQFDDQHRVVDSATIRLWRGGSITGTVVDEVDEPMIGVYVCAIRLDSEGHLLTGPTSRTDDRGVYHIGTLIPGSYVVVVPQTQAVVPTSTLDQLVTPGTNASSIRDRMAASRGPEPRPDGLAIDGVMLSTRSNTATTNVLLPPGVGPGRRAVYRSTFYPSVIAGDVAQRIQVASGEERAGVVIRLRPLPAVVVRGHLVDDFGSPVSFVGVHLSPMDIGSEAAALEVASTTTDAAGRYVFPLVPSGRFQVWVQQLAAAAGASGAPVAPAWAAQEVTVRDEDLEEVSLRLGTGLSIRGRLELATGASLAPGARVAQLQIALTRTEPLLRDAVDARAQIDASGNFTVSGLGPGRYRFRFLDLSPWSLQAVRTGATDLSDSTIVLSKDMADVVVTLTARAARVIGTVRTIGGVDDGSATVILFPADRTSWQRDGATQGRTWLSARVSRDGAFTFSRVLPGDYLIVAMSGEAADVASPAQLPALVKSATQVHVGAAADTTVSLVSVGR